MEDRRKYIPEIHSPQGTFRENRTASGGYRAAGIPRRRRRKRISKGNLQKKVSSFCRRELSLLSQTHREVSVAYYIHHKTCSEIAKEQHISVDMVKYHLFKTRKLLKEGIGMTRNLGEKSYNPGVFRINFWATKTVTLTCFAASFPARSCWPPMTFR